MLISCRRLVRVITLDGIYGNGCSIFFSIHVQTKIIFIHFLKLKFCSCTYLVWFKCRAKPKELLYLVTAPFPGDSSQTIVEGIDGRRRHSWPPALGPAQSGPLWGGGLFSLFLWAWLRSLVREWWTWWGTHVMLTIWKNNNKNKRDNKLMHRPTRKSYCTL